MAIFYAIGQMLFAVNGQILNKKSRNLVTLTPTRFDRDIERFRDFLH